MSDQIGHHYSGLIVHQLKSHGIDLMLDPVNGSRQRPFETIGNKVLESFQEEPKLAFQSSQEELHRLKLFRDQTHRRLIERWEPRRNEEPPIREIGIRRVSAYSLLGEKLKAPAYPDLVASNCKPLNAPAPKKGLMPSGIPKILGPVAQARITGLTDSIAAIIEFTKTIAELERIRRRGQEFSKQRDLLIDGQLAIQSRRSQV